MLKRKFISVFLAGLMMAGLQGTAFARLVGQSNETVPDQWACCHDVNYEVALDYLGNFLPTTTNAQALGSTTTRWSNVISVLGNFSGTLTAAGALNVTGNLTTAGQVINTPSSVQSVNYGTSTISATSRFVVIGSTSSMNMNAVNGPIISTISVSDGQMLTLISTGTTLGIPTDVTLNTAMVYSSTRGAFVSISSVTPRTFIFKSGTGWLQQ